MAKLKLAEGGTGVSFDGRQYEADTNGVVEVPEEAVAALASHGAMTVEAAEEAAAADQPKGRGRK